jgi:Helix-turn-helix domain
MAASFRSTDPDALLCEVQAADFLCLSPRTLQGWRLEGAGPRFVRAGRAIRYRRRDLIAWIDENTVDGSSLNPTRTIAIAV